MKWLVRLLGSSVGRKAILALTGLALLGFVVGHLLGNLQIFLGPEALNAYAAGLQDLGALLWVARGGLLFVFVVHIAVAVKLASENKAARPVAYVDPVGKVAANPATRLMLLSGLTVLLFVAYHIAHFTLGVAHPEHRQIAMDAGAHPDVYAMVIAGFSQPLVAILYIAAMAALGLHLHHGIASVFQTLGLTNKAYAPLLQKLGRSLAWALFLGNAAIPIAVLTGLVGGHTGA
ncbi:MAG: succinate dehydrogenase / fumarate reductase cytochrome b subunit [Pseudohongiellaceae bacterium]|jgi:succinate dehydrogenase / fumarate reductase cytochrome b subunit